YCDSLTSRLFTAASRTFCTAGKSSAISTARMMTTTSNSVSVKPCRNVRRIASPPVKSRSRPADLAVLRCWRKSGSAAGAGARAQAVDALAAGRDLRAVGELEGAAHAAVGPRLQAVGARLAAQVDGQDAVDGRHLLDLC